jgi:hypothetical protein
VGGNAHANVLLSIIDLFPRRSGTLALFSSFFSLTLNTGLLKKFAAAQFRKNAFLLYTLIEAPQETFETFVFLRDYISQRLSLSFVQSRQKP